MKSKYTFRDILFFLFLYLLAIITVYKLPHIASYLYFGLLLFLFWRSEKNAFWIVLMFFMLDAPGGLFPDDFNYGLPFIKGFNLRFLEIFIYVAFFKALRQKNSFNSVFNKSYQLLLLLTIVLLIYTICLDNSIETIIITIKWLFVWSLIYSIPKLIDTYEEWVFLFRIVFIIVFIAFFSQLLYLALGHPPAYLLGTNFSQIVDKPKLILEDLNPDEYDLNAARPLSCSSIVLTAIVGAMFFIQYKREIFPKIYLYLVIIISFLSILITATRGWFIAFSIVLFLYFIFVQKSLKKILSLGILALILIPLLLSISVIQKQFTGVTKRLSTVESLAQGDISAGGTNLRGEFSEKLIELWKENPILGWGFTDYFKDNNNGHAGLANLLLNVGIIGYLVFIYFWYKLFINPIAASKRISVANPFKGSLIVFSLAFLLFFILNATSGQQFGIYLGFGPGVFSQILFYSYSSFFIIMAMNTEDKIKQQSHDE